MRINFAHFWERSTDGGRIELAVFAANAQNGTDAGRDDVLHDLTMMARRAGYRIDKSAWLTKSTGAEDFTGLQT